MIEAFGWGLLAQSSLLLAADHLVSALGRVRPGKLIKDYSIPYSIVHAMQFFAFVKDIAAAATDGNTVRRGGLLAPAPGEVAGSFVRREILSPLDTRLFIRIG
jgi:hypothetical protein